MKKILKKFIPHIFFELREDLLKSIESRKEKKAYDDGKMEEYLIKWYKKRTGQILDLKHPKTYTEKQQWLKLYACNDMKIRCTDKWLVRDFIKDTIGEEYLIPIITNNGKSTFKNSFEIDFQQLPEQFVIQCNHGSGMTYIVKSKSILGEKGFRKIQRKLNKYLKINYAFRGGFEMVYNNIEPLIFITKYLTIGDDLPDYKFMCFNSKPCYVWVDTGRFLEHKRTVFDLNFSPTDFKLHTYPPVDSIKKPNVFKEMLEITTKLATFFDDYVRIDFYLVENNIYFGELTFSSGSGTELPKPDEANVMLGELLKLPID